MNLKTGLLIILVLTLSLALTGCMPGDERYSSEEPAGFLWGIWHGWIAPISLILGLIGKGTRLYEVNNTGLTYDIGFYIAVISGFGGLSISRSSKKNK